jgi:hypothetical protein
MCERCNPCTLRPLWIDKTNHPLSCWTIFGENYAIYEDNGGYLAVEIKDKSKNNRRILGKQATIEEIFKTIDADLLKKGVCK